MKIYTYPGPAAWPSIVARPEPAAEKNKKKVKKILKAVKAEGDEAVRRFSRKFDGYEPVNILLSVEEIAEAIASLPSELKAAIDLAAANIERFHLAQVPVVNKTETMAGICCWRKNAPIDKVGLYIPGGSAPLFSTVLMLGIPARIAGCTSVLLCTPPRNDGSIDPAIIYAASVCGIDKIARIGGVQAIAAMAYGTESVPKVYKIFGPGNSFVTLAKQLVQQGDVAIDMPAGPSEVLVIADQTADPDLVAADLLSQAEHGPDSQVILLTTDPMLPDRVLTAIERQVTLLPRLSIVERSLKHARIILLRTLEEAIQLSDLYAPEHLILSVSDPGYWGDQVRSAGSVFLGNYSSESAGDYASGTNHCLPTNGYAAMYSGVSLDSFVKKISYQQLSREGLMNISSAVMRMAEAEGLIAHKQAIAVRVKKIEHGESI